MKDKIRKGPVTLAISYDDLNKLKEIARTMSVEANLDITYLDLIRQLINEFVQSTISGKSVED